MSIPVTPETVAEALTAAGFAEYRDDQFGFTVTRAALGDEIIVDLKGIDLLPFNPGEGPRALLDDYLKALTTAGCQVRSAGAMVLVTPGPACNCLISGGPVLPACCKVHGIPCENCGGVESCTDDCGEVAR
jgi:hypothetical protein